MYGGARTFFAAWLGLAALASCSVSKDGLSIAQVGLDDDAGAGGNAGRPDGAAPKLDGGGGTGGMLPQPDGNLPVKLDASAGPDVATPPKLDTNTPPPMDTAPPAPRWPKIVGVGYGGRRAFSDDGVTWTDVRDNGAKGSVENQRVFRDVAYANDLIVAVGGGCENNNCRPRIAVYDGFNWSEISLPSGTKAPYLTGVAFGKGVWVAVAEEGYIWTSSDGRSWAEKAKLADDLVDVAFGRVGSQEIFVAVGDDGRRARSLDGTTWTDELTAILGIDTPPNLRSVAIAGGVVVAVGNRGLVLRSATAMTWERMYQFGPDRVSVVFDGREFLAFPRAMGAPESLVRGEPAASTWTNAETVINEPGGGVAFGQVGGRALFVGTAAPAGIKTAGMPLGWTTVFPGTADDPAFTSFTFNGR